MMLTMDGYRDLSRMLVAFADQVCDGRLVMIQAGGYSAMYVPYCTVAAVEPLLGVNLGLQDPDLDSSELERSKTIFSHDTQQALLAARTWHQRWWDI
jgi:acetoin utilization deacetylase AcuC-like enzyme